MYALACSQLCLQLLLVRNIDSNAALNIRLEELIFLKTKKHACCSVCFCMQPVVFAITIVIIIITDIIITVRIQLRLLLSLSRNAF